VQGDKIMEKNHQRKVYQKPSWQKQEMFERFAAACTKTTKACTTNKNS
jgi:hypothetical protein